MVSGSGFIQHAFIVQAVPVLRWCERGVVGRFESTCFLDQEFVDEWKVESGFIVRDEGMFHGPGFAGSWLNGQDDGWEEVVVASVVPPSDCKFTFSGLLL